MHYFITGIDTDSGKTFASAVLCEALSADYWKPIQAGLPRDADTVRELISNPACTIHPETYLLKTPASPHAAAKLDGVGIRVEDFGLPKTPRPIIIEGAGGCLVPLNDDQFIVDLVKHLGADVILVADLYLGSINHTLLTLEALNARGLSIKGIIFNGDSNPESERIILHHSGIPCLLRMAREKNIDKEIVKKYARLLNENWYE